MLRKAAPRRFMESQSSWFVTLSGMIVGRLVSLVRAAVGFSLVAEVWSWIEILTAIVLYYCLRPDLVPNTHSNL